MEEIRSFLGQRVRISYSQDNGQFREVSVGTFIGFSEGGDFEILEDDGFVHFCWPLLHIEKVDEDA